MKTSLLYFVVLQPRPPLPTLCQYHSDCILPQVCCRFGILNYCCERKDLVLIPIPISKNPYAISTLNPPPPPLTLSSALSETTLEGVFSSLNAPALM